MNRLAPPGGEPPPRSVDVLGERLDLEALAREVTRRFMAAVPEYGSRYGDAALTWCVHDAQHKIHWAALDVGGFVDLENEIRWLAEVLRARGFPLAWLAQALRIAAEVVNEELPARVGDALSTRLRHGAEIALEPPGQGPRRPGSDGIAAR